MINLLIGYWVLTTIYGVYWLIKHPSERHGDDMNEFTLFEVFGKIFPSMILAPFFVPMMILESIKFKR
jgi:hypothetical protein